MIKALHEDHRNKLRSQQITTHTSWGVGSLIIVTVLLVFLFLGLRYSKGIKKECGRAEIGGDGVDVKSNNGNKERGRNGEHHPGDDHGTLSKADKSHTGSTHSNRTGTEPGTSSYLQMRRASADSEIYDRIHEEADLDHDYRPSSAEEAKVDEKKRTGRIVFIH